MVKPSLLFFSILSTAFVGRENGQHLICFRLRKVGVNVLLASGERQLPDDYKDFDTQSHLGDLLA